MPFIEKAIALFTPFDCLACGEEGSILCNSCRDLLVDLPSRCYRCRRLTTDYKTCQKCRKTSRLNRVMPVTEYESVPKDLVWHMKFLGAQAAVSIMTGAMLQGLARYYSSEITFLVPVPTSSRRARERGYDQARLMARELSERTAIPYFDCLKRMGNARQVGASRAARTNQLKDAFRTSKTKKVSGAHLILVDDVITTGATLEAAARILKDAGAAKVDAIVFAQA